MAFLKHKQFTEIQGAAKEGNEKAKMVLQALMNGSEQGDLDGLVNDYYNLVNEPIQDEKQEEEENYEIQEEVVESEPETTPIQTSVDISSLLDDELDGILDENEIDDISFGDYIKNKKRDNLRAKKNSEYFRAFDGLGRENYVKTKGENYSNKFNSLRDDIERANRDHTKSLDGYMGKVNLMLDDDIELDMNLANDAYNEFTENENTMKSFGRHWDDEDNTNVVDALNELVVKFGKKNVIAALNTLKSDSENYRGHRMNLIDTETGRYQKNLEKLLK